VLFGEAGPVHAFTFWGPGAGHPLDAVPEVGQQRVDLADLEVQHPVIDLAHLRLQGGPAQYIPQAVMRAAAEGLVRIGAARPGQTAAEHCGATSIDVSASADPCTTMRRRAGWVFPTVVQMVVAR
jgi:hypothetical protein